MRRRVRAAVVALGAACVALPPVPAHACSCGPVDAEAALADGHALAVVTRIDDDTGPRATFAVERSVGPALPPQLTGLRDDMMQCEPELFVGGVAAMIVERRRLADGTQAWYLGDCIQAWLGEGLHRVLGDAPTPGVGPAVAYVAGEFGAHRLAALDAQGRVIAWDDRAGGRTRAAVCPGGGVVAAVGQRPYEFGGRSGLDLTVHDGRTLRTLGAAVELPATWSGSVLALRCADRWGRHLEVVVQDDPNTAHGWSPMATLVVVRGGALQPVPLGGIELAAPVSDGFVAVEGQSVVATSPPPSVVRVGPDGEAIVLAVLGDLSSAQDVAVSPDGLTVAVHGYPADGAAGRPVITLDARTGERLGAWAPDGGGVGRVWWTAGGDLLAETFTDAGTASGRLASSPTVPELRVLDRGLREVGRRPLQAGGSFFGTTVGDAIVSFGGVRLRVTPPSGPPLVLDELRLAGAEDVVGVPGRAFALAAAAPRPLPAPDPSVGQPPPARVFGKDPLPDFRSLLDSPGEPEPTRLGLATGAAGLLAATWLLAVRRRRRDA